MRILWLCVFLPCALFADEIIREDDILRKMEREIGLTERDMPRRSEPERKLPDPVQPGRIVFSGGRELRAHIVLSQKSVVFLNPGRRVVLSSVKRIEFTAFREMLGRYVPFKARVVLKDASVIEGEVRPEDWISLGVQSADVIEEVPAFFRASTSGEIAATDPKVPAGIPIRLELMAEEAAAAP